MLRGLWLYWPTYLLEHSPPDILNELTRWSHQLLLDNDELFIVWIELCDIDLCLDVNLVVECFTQRRLEHIARIWWCFILQKGFGERPSLVQVCLFEIPWEILGHQQLSYPVESHFVSLKRPLCKFLIVNGFDLDERGIVEVYSVVEERIWIKKHDEVVCGIAD